MTPYILLVPQLILGVVFIIGLGTGIIQSLGVIPAFGLTEPTLKYYKEVLTRPDLLQSLKYSLYIAFMSAFLATVTGTFLCAVLVSAGKVRGIIMRIVQIPIIVPHVVVALFIVNILSQNGILARILANAGLITDQQQFPMLLYDRYGLGVILAYLWKEIPFIIYFVIALMANINGSLGEAATNLGANKLQAFMKVTLPLCMNTVLSGFLIIFVFALGAYELPFILGATIPKALQVRRNRKMKRKKNIWEGLIIGIFIFLVIVPILTILVWVGTERWAWPSLIPQKFSMRAVNGILRNRQQLVRLCMSSLFISASVAFLSVVIGTMTARALECYDFFGKRLFSFMSMLPFLVPGTVFAMGVQITFIKCGLSGTVQGVIIVHLICSLPYAVTLMQDGTRAMGVKLEEQARVLGAGALQAFFKVTLPNLFPVMLSAFSMAFVVSFSQYFLTLMIGGGNVKTFAIVMVPYLGSGERNFASIYSVIFLVIMLLVFGILEWIVGRFTKAQEVEYY